MGTGLRRIRELFCGLWRWRQQAQFYFLKDRDLHERIEKRKRRMKENILILYISWQHAI